MVFNPHKLGVHKVLKYIPLNAIFDAPYKRKLAKAVNIADLRLIAKSRAHKVRHPWYFDGAIGSWACPTTGALRGKVSTRLSGDSATVPRSRLSTYGY